MVFKKQAKRAQAAIEFLMTYGWMLLIVLIVGALIFSFVDFGNLIPNQINLNNNIQAQADRSVAYSQNSVTNANNVSVVFQYNGPRKITIPSSEGEIDLSVGGTCDSSFVENVDTNENSTMTTGSGVSFLNSQTGVIMFDCDPGETLLEGDNLEGDIRIGVQDPQTGMIVPSTGEIRLQVITG